MRNSKIFLQVVSLLLLMALISSGCNVGLIDLSATQTAVAGTALAQEATLTALEQAQAALAATQTAMSFTATPTALLTVVYCTDNGSGGTETIPVEPPRTVDQIRIDLEERATGYGFSLWEVRAYGPDTGNTNLVIGGDANASTEQDSPGCIGCFAYNAIDGDMNTRWSSDWKDEQSLEIDLPDPQVVNRIVLRWEQAYARKYCVAVIEP